MTITFEPLLPVVLGAACAGHPEPLWDELVHRETAADRTRRHERAAAICARCPAKSECLQSRDPEDGGIYGGQLFAGPGRAVVHRSERRRRVGLDSGIKPCSVCGCPTVLPRARNEFPQLRQYKRRISGRCTTCDSRLRRLHPQPQRYRETG